MVGLLNNRSTRCKGVGVDGWCGEMDEELWLGSWGIDV